MVFMVFSESRLNLKLVGWSHKSTLSAFSTTAKPWVLWLTRLTPNQSTSHFLKIFMQVHIENRENLIKVLSSKLSVAQRKKRKTGSHVFTHITEHFHRFRIWLKKKICTTHIFHHVPNKFDFQKHSFSFTKTFSSLLRLILNTMNYQVPDLQGHKFFILPPNNMYLPKKKNKKNPPQPPPTPKKPYLASYNVHLFSLYKTLFRRMFEFCGIQNHIYLKKNTQFLSTRCKHYFINKIKIKPESKTRIFRAISFLFTGAEKFRILRCSLVKLNNKLFRLQV